MQNAIAVAAAAGSPFQRASPRKSTLALITPMPPERDGLSSTAFLCCHLSSRWVQIPLSPTPEQSPRLTFTTSLTAKQRTRTDYQSPSSQVLMLSCGTVLLMLLLWLSFLHQNSNIAQLKHALEKELSTFASARQFISSA